jgi:hypothetical protein
VVDQGRKSGEFHGIDPLFVKVALGAKSSTALPSSHCVVSFL